MPLYCSRGHLSAKQALQNHIRKFHEHRYQCNICGKDFAGKIPLKYHKKAIHEGIKDELHKCEHCGKEYTHKLRLRIHIKHKHENARDEKCDQCGKLFFCKETLRRHIGNVHDNGKVKCDQ